MSAVELLVKVLLAVAVVAFIGYPLLRDHLADEEDLELPEEAEELYRRKEATYSALKELEFDYKTGKLSEQDFNELETRFKADALEILEAIDQLEHPTPKGKATRRIETEKDGVESKRRVSAVLSADTCGSCGNVNPSGARFCAVCGDPLAVAPASSKSVREPADTGGMCASCGTRLDVDHRFCGACGAEVSA
ncbi:MAG: zinc ribbon domain-containing protein [Thermoleophilia bacterium]|nr:zinc ribbon domain-containing protein [Thermoleophilia bacterium]